MKGWQMYGIIQRMKDLSFKKTQVARKIGLDVRTVAKYWEMDADSFAKIQKRYRTKVLSTHEEVVVNWLKEYPDMSSAQVWDWLKEHYQIESSERTVRRYVEILRNKYNIAKPKRIRQYEAVSDPPMGRQMQVDLGEIVIRKAYEGRFIKLYCVACVLSNSRYKSGVWFDHPLTVADLVRALADCFEYFGGATEELVFDQDRLVAVNENYGDIIYTYEFEKFRQQIGFEVRLCRAADPESKGRVEAVVKFFKRNFAKNRLFMDLKIWNESFEDWLIRTGNAKIHGVTKKIPAEVFAVEVKYLKPVAYTNQIISATPILTRLVHKDNTVFYEGNRYTVPFGTYKPGLEVALDIENNILTITDPFGDIVYASHLISCERGKLIKNTNHRRDNSTGIDQQFNELCEMFGNTEKATDFLLKIRKFKSRYVRDQYGLIKKMITTKPASVVHQALEYCIKNQLYSAVDLKDAVEYFIATQSTINPPVLKEIGKVIPLLMVKAQKRNISEYSKLVGGDSQ
jgi:transposase